MGRAGIRRRKGVHHLPKVHDGLSADEEARAFGQFRWGQFTPAGGLERSGFFLRQAVRRSEHPEWQKYNHVTVAIGWGLVVMLYVGLVVALMLTMLHLAVGFP
jgi:preprotein translocase subunit Sss1